MATKLTNPYTGGQVEVEDGQVERFKLIGFVESEAKAPAPKRTPRSKSTSEKSED